MSDFIANTNLSVETTRAAVGELAMALGKTTEFMQFEQSSHRLQSDPQAQSSINALQAKQHQLQALLMLNAVSAEERAELEQLEQAVFDNPVIAEYLKAQEEVAILCRAVNDLISQGIGMRFAMKTSSCCG